MKRQVEKLAAEKRLHAAGSQWPDAVNTVHDVLDTAVYVARSHFAEPEQASVLEIARMLLKLRAVEASG